MTFCMTIPCGVDFLLFPARGLRKSAVRTDGEHAKGVQMREETSGARGRHTWVNAIVCTWALLVGALLVGSPVVGEEAPFVSPEILVLGDSQIPFGSGEAFLDFFSDLASQCMAEDGADARLAQLDGMRVGVIGVRSTSIHSWVAKSGAPKDAICEEDKKWKVNAGTYGVVNTGDSEFVQIGKGQQYQFCAEGKSAFEEMFRADYYAPQLLFMSFLGNATSRWAASLEAAVQDVEAMMRQLPPELPCVFMTTQPPYKESTIAKRVKAQSNLMMAFAKAGARCSFLPGSTPETIAANQGNALHFRRRDDGTVRDPFHPNDTAAKQFFELQRGAICEAVLEQFER